MDVLTKGDVIVNKLKIGDIIYEYDMGLGIRSEVTSLPIRDEEGLWSWDCKSTTSGEHVGYAVNENYPHYSPNIYTYEAYQVNHYL